MSFNLKDCDELCTFCVSDYIKKHKVKKGGKFETECSGIPKVYIKDHILSALGEDNELTVSSLDPVTWAKVYLDWHCLDPDGEVWKRKSKEGTLPPNAAFYDEDDPVCVERAKNGKSIFHRPYQAEMLRCSSKYKVFRIGRQAGKCLVSGTMVLMADGSLRPIEALKDGDMVLGLDDDYKFISAKAYKQSNGVKPVAKLELMDGREIEGSLNHPFLVRRKLGRETTGKRRVILEDEWVELGNLSPGDMVAVPRNVGEIGSDSSKELHKISLLGLMLSDGNLTSNNCRFSNVNEIILNEFKNNVYGGFSECRVRQYECDNDCDYHILGNGSGKVHPVKEWFKGLGIYGLDSHQKYIPDFILTLKNKEVSLLLNRMYGCDGWACVSKSGKPEIGYSTVSEKMAFQVVSLLSRFGIYADIRHKTTTVDGQKFHSRQIVISRKESIIRFVDEIGLLGKQDSAEFAKIAALGRGPSPKTEIYEDNDIVFVPVRSITSTGNKETWDLSVPSVKNFIANNIVSHNTEVLCISVSQAVWTNSKFKAVIIAPYQSQIDMIFGRISEIFKTNSVLAGSIVQNVKAPNYKIQLRNGSSIVGFTAGTRSGQEAGAARGQPANMLLFDEADYLSPGDVNTALATIANFPEATVWMSSTPTGRREKFFETCNSTEYKEFFFPSHVNPNWTEKQDKFFKSQLTEAGYKHEILAEFGEQEEGVYQHRFIEAAMASYKYSDMKPLPGWVYMIGVDWNDRKIGTQIAVIGASATDKNLYLVDKAVIQRGEWTQLTACNRIAELNRKWNPAYIYVDQGFGTTQIEVLTKFGYDETIKHGPKHPNARLREIVKGYSFSTSVEITDPFTKQKVKKHSKSFLVENSVRRFEQQMFKFPEEDELYASQLRGYIIKSVSVYGQPIYAAQDEKAGDHLLDAVNLGLVAFTLEKSAFGAQRFTADIAMSSSFGLESTKAKEETRNEEPKSRVDGLTKDPHWYNELKNRKLPLANANNAVDPTRVWSYPGFMRDLPPPRGPSTGGVPLGLGKHKTTKPSRKKF